MSRNEPGALRSTHRRCVLPRVSAIALGVLFGMGAFNFGQVAAINWSAAK